MKGGGYEETAVNLVKRKERKKKQKKTPIENESRCKNIT